mgnify:CR=1 FL=1
MSAFRTRTIGENMTQMALTLAGGDFHTVHPVAEVLFVVECVTDHGAGEAGPAATGVVLAVRREQGLARHHININTWFVECVVFAAEGAFSVLLLGYTELLRGEFFENLLPAGSGIVGGVEGAVCRSEADMAVATRILLQVILVVVLCRTEVAEWFCLCLLYTSPSPRD